MLHVEGKDWIFGYLMQGNPKIPTVVDLVKIESFQDCRQRQIWGEKASNAFAA
jgi:hypothetical protein